MHKCIIKIIIPTKLLTMIISREGEAQRKTELTCGTGAADTRGVAARGRGLAAGAASHQWHRLVAAVEVPEGDTGVEDVEDRDF